MLIYAAYDAIYLIKLYNHFKEVYIKEKKYLDKIIKESVKNIAYAKMNLLIDSKIRYNITDAHLDGMIKYITLNKKEYTI